MRSRDVIGITVDSKPHLRSLSFEILEGPVSQLSIKILELLLVSFFA
jgi:hypothetical protein